MSTTPDRGDDPRGPEATSPATDEGEGPDKERAEEESEQTRREWLIALASALGGAILTLLGDRAKAAYLERRTLRSLLKYVADEVTEIKSTAQHRWTRARHEAFEFDAPIGTSAWQLVTSSDVGWRLVLREDLFASLTTLYDDVASANHQRAVAVEMFTLSQSAEPDEARSYLAQALGLMYVPYKKTADKADMATLALRKKRWPW